MLLRPVTSILAARGAVYVRGNTSRVELFCYVLCAMCVIFSSWHAIDIFGFFNIIFPRTNFSVC